MEESAAARSAAFPLVGDKAGGFPAGSGSSPVAMTSGLGLGLGLGLAVGGTSSVAFRRSLGAVSRPKALASPECAIPSLSRVLAATASAAVLREGAADVFSPSSPKTLVAVPLVSCTPEPPASILGGEPNAERCGAASSMAFARSPRFRRTRIRGKPRDPWFCVARESRMGLELSLRIWQRQLYIALQNLDLVPDVRREAVEKLPGAEPHHARISSPVVGQEALVREKHNHVHDKLRGRLSSHGILHTRRENRAVELHHCQPRELKHTRFRQRLDVGREDTAHEADRPQLRFNADASEALIRFTTPGAKRYNREARQHVTQLLSPVAGPDLSDAWRPRHAGFLGIDGRLGFRAGQASLLSK
eukprot:scaffold1954_cov268-Pinguiococcus_pyrenoidosus.AAC.187